jgi:hypothetical protein
MEQTVYLGTTTTDIVVYAQAIDSSGSHVALVVDTTQTKLVFANGTQSSVVPSVTSLGTGKAKITFASVTNSGNLAAGDSVCVKVNGSSSGISFSEYLIPVFIDSAGGGGGGLTQADVRSAVGLASANLDTQLSTIDSVVDAVLIDTATDIPASIAALNNFDPASDTVANVSAVGSVTNPVTTDAASRTASQADVSSLATAASIAALNDIAATDIVSAGAITTLNGAVVNVDLVDVTTTNSDMVSVAGLSTFDASTDQVVASNMRGTDGANTVAPDNATISSINAKTSQLTFTVANQVDANSLTGGTSPTDIYNFFTSGSNENAFKADVSALATSASIAALNDLSSTDVENSVWDASLSSHNTGGSTGKALKNLKEGIVSYEGQVNDTSATTTSFITNLTSSVDDFYNSQTIHFISGTLQGQSRLVLDYDGSTKTITVEEQLSSAPANGAEFIILSTHVHTIAEIADGVWDEAQSGHANAGTFGYYLDAAISGVSSGGGDATASNQTTIIGHLTDMKGATFSESTDSLEAIRDRGDAAWLTSSAAGTGLYEVTVTVEDSSNSALQGARIAVEGTTLFLTTDSSGSVTFNLDSGVYLLACSPPAGYQTPTDLVASVSTSNVSVEFTLTANPSSSCDQPWIG